MPTNRKASSAIERNPVLLSLQLLREMGIEQPMHTKFAPLWGPLWVALINYRDKGQGTPWDTRVLNALLSSDTKFDKGPEWDELNRVLNEIWEKANA